MSFYFKEEPIAVKFSEDFMSEITINSPSYEKKALIEFSDKILEKMSEEIPWIKATDYRLLADRAIVYYDEDGNQVGEGLSFEDILKLQADLKISDIHLGRWDFPFFKVGNEQIRVGFAYDSDVFANQFWKRILSFQDTRVLFFDWLDPVQKETLLTTGSLNREYKLLRQDGDGKDYIQKFRLNIHLEKGGFAISCRFINAVIPKFEDLKGIPSMVQNLVKMPSGLIVISAPTNNGKSYTLSSVLDFINSNYEKHIITIEDPIETMFEPKKSKITQRQVGTDTASTYLASKDVLRQDWNVVMIGEARTEDEIEAAINLATNGLLVLMTSHTKSAYEFYRYVYDICSPERKGTIIAGLNDTLNGILCQRINRKQDPQTGATVYQTAYELFVNNQQAKAGLMWENGKINFSVIKNQVEWDGKAFGSVSMNNFIFNKMVEWEYTIQDGFKMSYDPKGLIEILKENNVAIPEEIMAIYEVKKSY